MIRFFKILILIFIAIFCCGEIGDKVAHVSVNKPNIEHLENIFKSVIPPNIEIIYTKVPRGLIISINEQLFFNRGSIKIRQSSLPLLNSIIKILKETENFCIVEDHSDADGVNESNYKSNWELTIARSANLVQYIIRCGGINPNRIFSIGFGEFMPFKDNVAETGNMDNRVDFVFIDYEAKR